MEGRSLHVHPPSPLAEEDTSQSSHTGRQISSLSDDSPASPEAAPDAGVQEEEEIYPVHVLGEKLRLHNKHKTRQQTFSQLN